MSNPKVKVVITIDGKQYEAGLAKADDKTEKLGNTAKKTDKKILGMAKSVNRASADIHQMTGAVKLLAGGFVGIKLAGLIRDIVVTGATFQKSMSNVASVAGATGDQMDLLSFAARNYARTSIFTATQAAEAQYFLASAGQEVNEIIASQAGVMALAAATQSELGTTSEITTATLAQFGLDADESTRVANVFAAAISGSQANMKKLGDAMRYVGPVANSLDEDLESTTAAVSLLFNAGFRGEQAGTALRASLIALSKPSAEAAGLIKDMGLRVTDTQGRFVGMESLVRQLGDSQLDLNKAATLFGTEAAPAMLALVRQGADDFVTLRDSITDTNKAIEMADEQMDNLSGDWDKLGSAAEELALQLFDDLEPALRAVTQAATGMINALSDTPRSISAIEAEIAALEARIPHTTSRQGIRDNLKFKLAKLKEELLVAQKLQSLEDAGGTGGGSGRGDGSGGAGGAGGTGGTGGAGGDDGASTTKTGDSLQQTLERQIALYGQVSKAAKVRYETEHGSLTKLDPVAKKHLLGLAEELDSMKANDEFMKANDEAVREAIATQNEWIESDRELAEAKREAAQAGLEAVELMTATEAESENQRYQLALEQLQTAEDAELEIIGGYDEQRERLKIEHEQRLTNITQQGLSDREKFQQLSAGKQAKTVLGFMAGVLGSAAQHNKKLFKVNQMVGIANATISMYEGVMKAWAMGPILGPILAPIVAAAGLVNISAIKNASFGGGGAVGTYSASPSTGLPTASADPYARSSSAQNAQGSTGGGVSYFNIAGNSNDTVTVEQLEQIFEGIEEATERGDRIFFTRNSHQGLELREEAA